MTTSNDRMKRWRENPENRKKEYERNLLRRRERGVAPQVRLTEEERTERKRAYVRKRYWLLRETNPEKLREIWRRSDAKRRAKKPEETL